jgi:hypothetical protein
MACKREDVRTMVVVELEKSADELVNAGLGEGQVEQLHGQLEVSSRVVEQQLMETWGEMYTHKQRER